MNVMRKFLGPCAARIEIFPDHAVVFILDYDDVEGTANAHALVGTIRNIFCAYRILRGSINILDINNIPQAPYLDRSRFSALRAAGIQGFYAILSTQEGPQPLCVPLFRFVSPSQGNRNHAAGKLLKACQPISHYLRDVGVETLLLEARSIGAPIADMSSAGPRRTF